MRPSEPTSHSGEPLDSVAIACWSSERLSARLKQAPFAHHRGQVEDVGYGPQRIFITSWCGESQESVTAETRHYTRPALVERHVVLRYRGKLMGAY